jgi:hypothetical protein
MPKKSAVQAKKLTSTELVEVLPRPDITVVPEQSMSRVVEAKVDPTAEFTIRMDWDEVRMTAARLYGRGFRRSQIARALLEVLNPPNTKARTDEQKMSSARGKLKRWERNQEFRDLVYQHAIVDLDMSTPGILVGLAKRAKRGRVDAARLALELTGRHSRDAQAQGPAQVTVNLIGVSRPE